MKHIFLSIFISFFGALTLSHTSATILRLENTENTEKLRKDSIKSKIKNYCDNINKAVINPTLDSQKLTGILGDLSNLLSWPYYATSVQVEVNEKFFDDKRRQYYFNPEDAWKGYTKNSRDNINKINSFMYYAELLSEAINLCLQNSPNKYTKAKQQDICDNFTKTLKDVKDSEAF